MATFKTKTIIEVSLTPEELTTLRNAGVELPKDKFECERESKKVSDRQMVWSNEDLAVPESLHIADNILDEILYEMAMVDDTIDSINYNLPIQKGCPECGDQGYTLNDMGDAIMCGSCR